MSGIRACDQELLALGLTLPGFVERSKAIASLPSLGLLTLAGMTPRRHQVRYLEIADFAHADTLPRDLDLVAISSLSAQVKDAYRIADRYAGLGIPVVIGGLHVTARPNEPGEHGASAIVGEGEVVWEEVLEDAERGHLKPVYDARGRDFDLANAPMPAFELLDIHRYNRLTVQTSRGCPWRCAFCASSILLTRKYKQKPIAKVLAEIDHILSLWPQPFIEFADDNSFVNRSYWRELLPELRKRNIKWFTETDLSVYQDEDLLEAMREAGCVEVLIGFESPVRDGLNGLELNNNFKWKRCDEYRTAIRTIQRHGIRVNACFVIGLDGHTPQIVDLLMDFVRDTLPFDVQVTVPTPFPGTPFYEQLRIAGRLIDPRGYERCTLFDVNFQPQGMTVDELRFAIRRLAVDLYNEDFTNHRRSHFRATWRTAQRLHRTTHSTLQPALEAG
jgi:radical SAM superfamily enzyme YgiQ (UPF0313 family)